MSRGQQTLSVELKNINASSAYYERNEISLSVWGVNGQFENTLSAAGPKQSGALEMESVQLLNVELGDSDSNEWQMLSWELDFGLGYQYLLAEIHMKKGNQAGDYVAIDNFMLTSDGAMELGASSLATDVSGFQNAETDVITGTSSLLNTTTTAQF